MTAAIGFPTLRLVRITIGVQSHPKAITLTLGNLQPGKWREVSPEEHEALHRLL
jgi:23S rRNA pseudouridine2457 synthase